MFSEITVQPGTLTDCPSLAYVLISANERAFRGRVPDDCLDSLTPEQSEKNWTKNFDENGNFKRDEHLLVATYKEQVIGLILSATLSKQQKGELSGLESYSRELSVLSVDPSWHKKGIGRRLVRELVRLLLAENETHLLVRCLKDNQYCIFYERLGALKLGMLPYNWEGYQTDEVLYGWSDITSLAVDV